MRSLDAFVSGALATIKWLALPVALLLFLQWPLRDHLQAYSRETNDLGQWLFALYVAASITAATRAGQHIATDVIAARYSRASRHGLAWLGASLGLLPWCGLIIWAGWPIVTLALQQTERFPDTGNPGYFMIKVALVVLVALIILQMLLDLAKPGHPHARTEPRP
jgi:TRAP-type mannitol/chloroaromatic compound transport system permease small subunit